MQGLSTPSCSGRGSCSPQTTQTSLLYTTLIRKRSCSRVKTTRVAATDTENNLGVKPGVPLISSKEIGPIPFPIDNETFQDVMAFTGPAPERVNGRVSMWAFLICSLTELTSGQSVAQQALAHPISATFLGLVISLASLAPKYVTGVSLEELQDTASREGLPENLRFFNKTHEIWLGRVAMIGFLGLVGLETFLGRALFAR